MAVKPIVIAKWGRCTLQITVWKGNGDWPPNYLGLYVMQSSKFNHLFRVGAFGIDATIKDGKPILKRSGAALRLRINNNNNGETSEGREWEVIFFAAFNADDLVHLARAEIYLQGELYRRFTYRGNSIFQADGKERVARKAHAAIRKLARDPQLLKCMWLTKKRKRREAELKAHRPT